MASTIRAVILLPTAVLALAALGACNKSGASKDTAAAGGSEAPADLATKLFSDNFKGVCSGASVAKAAAYDPKASGHKALYFSPYKDDLTDSSSSLPPDWTVQFATDKDALTAIDLVACSKRTAAREVKVCSGYKNEGKETQNKVRWHTATYELTLREARTGKLLDQTSVEANDTECPMFASFDNPDETIDDYDRLSDSAVNDFLKKHIAP